jgi:hypothetical protein
VGFKDIMLGGRADYTYLPGVSERSAAVSGMNWNAGKPAKSAKRLLGALDSGADVSDIGAFSPFMQEQAADLQGIDFDYDTGGNALLAQGGGEQANQLNRMRDLAKQRRMEMTGRQMSAAIPEFRRQASETLERRNSEKDFFRRWQQEQLNQLNSQVFDRRRQGGGLLGQIVQGAAGAAGSFLGRPPGVPAKPSA